MGFGREGEVSVKWSDGEDTNGGDDTRGTLEMLFAKGTRVKQPEGVDDTLLIFHVSMCVTRVRYTLHMVTIN